MISEAQDFLEEARALEALLTPLEDAVFQRATQFKNWSINDVLQHLHVWNSAAGASVRDEDELAEMLADMRAAPSLRAFERAWIGDVSGRNLLTLWWDGAQATADLFAALDSKQRLKWVGPSMSARSSITARQMETWAHGQEVFDLLGVERADGDRLRNIAHLGVTTFGWTYAVRGRAAPSSVPYVELVAPSGAIWTWNERSADECVRGDAVEFCQVVTQTRNIADTALQVSGPIAREWMAMAQCFAGAAREPPPPGTRFKQRVHI